MANEIYKSIVKAVNKGVLKEPFNAGEVYKVCPKFSLHTYSTFLPKHRKNNPGNNSELFERVSRGFFKLLKPIKYGII